MHSTIPTTEPGQPGIAAAAPIQLHQRSDWLDALRGFALLGILLYNIQVFGGYVFRGLLPPAQRLGAALDPTLDFWAHVLIQGKFYSLFSFLFGLGLALQLRRMREDGLPVLLRRLFWLLAFGLAHALLIWFGDILTVYALFGFALLAFRRLSQRALLACALGFLALPVLVYPLFIALGVGNPLAFDPGVPVEQSPIGKALRAIMGDSYAEVVRIQLTLYPGGWIRRAVQLALPRIFGMFLLGVWAARIGLPALDAQRRALLRVWLGCALAFGLPFNIAFSIMGGNEALFPAGAEGLLAVALASAGMPLLCLGYIACFGLFWRARGPASLFVVAGRTAFSHYLGQSVACVVLFYGFGLGLFGRLSYATSLLVALAVFALLALAGRAWLARHAQGPMELLWRRLSYGRPAPGGYDTQQGMPQEDRA